MSTKQNKPETTVQTNIPDRFNWSNIKMKIDETPRFLRQGELVFVLYGEMKEEEQDGKFGKQILYKLKVRRQDGSLGFIYVNAYQFSEITAKFEQLNYPSEVVYVRIR